MPTNSVNTNTQSKKTSMSNKKNTPAEEEVKDKASTQSAPQSSQPSDKKVVNKSNKKPQSQQLSKMDKAPESKLEAKPKAKVNKKTEKKESDNSGEASQVSLSEEFDQILEAFTEINKRVKELVGRVKVLQRRVGKEHRDLEKAAKGKRKKNQNGGEKSKRQPSGFAKPTQLSKELCNFLSVDENTQLARTEVTKKITTYVKNNNLQNPKNKKQIMPDSKLGSLLKVPKGEELTYFNLQKYLKHHFQKAQAAN